MEKSIKKAEVYDLSALVEYSEGSIVSKTILKNDSGNLTAFAFSKGEGLSEHKAPFDAFVQILEGSAEIKIDGKCFYPQKNQFLIMPANVVHSLFAVEDFKMLLIMLRD